ncbi:MAG: NYN domain-containing protein [Bacteroidales bacterium]|jgi:uncharacterized LabA/DUF88 family protein|nr:NYN domain-containing protein [Bacteroidales bacterium]
MNIYKVAILFDGAFFRKRYCYLHRAEPRASQVNDYINDVMVRINALTTVYDHNSQDVLFRAFYYDCRPYGGIETRPGGGQMDFSQSTVFIASNAFHKDLKTMNQLALRLGELSFDGWKIDIANPTAPPRPDFKQKGVDMKIGMDIAWMATKKTVDKIVLIAGDSDFVSPMKYARKEGLWIYLDAMRQAQIKLLLKEHADFIL